MSRAHLPTKHWSDKLYTMRKHPRRIRDLLVVRAGKTAEVVCSRLVPTGMRDLRDVHARIRYTHRVPGEMLQGRLDQVHLFQAPEPAPDRTRGLAGLWGCCSLNQLRGPHEPLQITDQRLDVPRASLDDGLQRG